MNGKSDRFLQEFEWNEKEEENLRANQNESSKEEMSCSSKLVSKAAPEVNPYIWMVVNLFCFVFTFCMLMCFLFFPDNSVPKNIATYRYFQYDFITTFIWWFEISLSFYYNRQNCSYIVGFEFLLACYFFIDCITRYWRGRIGDDENLVEDEGSLILNVLAYAYGFHSSFQLYQQRTTYETLP